MLNVLFSEYSIARAYYIDGVYTVDFDITERSREKKKKTALYVISMPHACVEYIHVCMMEYGLQF